MSRKVDLCQFTPDPSNPNHLLIVDDSDEGPNFDHIKILSWRTEQADFETSTVPKILYKFRVQVADGSPAEVKRTALRQPEFGGFSKRVVDTIFGAYWQRLKDIATTKKRRQVLETDDHPVISFTITCPKADHAPTPAACNTPSTTVHEEGLIIDAPVQPVITEEAAPVQPVIPFITQIIEPRVATPPLAPKPYKKFASSKPLKDLLAGREFVVAQFVQPVSGFDKEYLDYESSAMENFILRAPPCWRFGVTEETSIDITFLATYENPGDSVRLWLAINVQPSSSAFEQSFLKSCFSRQKDCAICFDGTAVFLYYYAQHYYDVTGGSIEGKDPAANFKHWHPRDKTSTAVFSNFFRDPPRFDIREQSEFDVSDVEARNVPSSELAQKKIEVDERQKKIAARQQSPPREEPPTIVVTLPPAVVEPPQEVPAPIPAEPVQPLVTADPTPVEPSEPVPVVLPEPVPEPVPVKVPEPEPVKVTEPAPVQPLIHPAEPIPQDQPLVVIPHGGLLELSTAALAQLAQSISTVMPPPPPQPPSAVASLPVVPSVPQEVVIQKVSKKRTYEELEKEIENLVSAEKKFVKRAEEDQAKRQKLENDIRGLTGTNKDLDKRYSNQLWLAQRLEKELIAEKKDTAKLQEKIFALEWEKTQHHAIMTKEQYGSLMHAVDFLNDAKSKMDDAAKLWVRGFPTETSHVSSSSPVLNAGAAPAPYLVDAHRNTFRMAADNNAGRK